MHVTPHIEDNPNDTQRQQILYRRCVEEVNFTHHALDFTKSQRH